MLSYDKTSTIILENGKFLQTPIHTGQCGFATKTNTFYHYVRMHGLVIKYKS